jgi:hypothetical protein
MRTVEPVMVDFGVPTPARMYDYFLGGKDHFPADRVAAEKVITACPQARAIALENRLFLLRAVEFLANQGIRQFVDLGTGLPTSLNVHEVVRRIQPDARVAYVDNDPVVMVHSRALCSGEDGLAVVEGDIRRPQAILTDPELTGLIDLSEPVGFLCVAVLHFITDDESPREIIAALQERMAPGSYLVISHLTTDGGDRRALQEIMDVYKGTSAPVVPRTESAIRGLFTGLNLAEPGLTDVARWRCAIPSDTANIRIVGGAGRNPWLG